MMDLAFLEGLIRTFDDSGVDSLEIERGGTRIRLSKTPPTVVAPAASAPAVPDPSLRSPDAPSPAPSSSLLDVTSPMVGTFYGAPAPDAQPYVDIGTRVTPGDTLCIIEAMKLMNELECEVSGTIAEICIDNAQPVEFGQVLFRVDPS